MSAEESLGEKERNIPSRNREILDRLLHELQERESALCPKTQEEHGKGENFGERIRSSYVQRSIRGENSIISEINRRLEDVEELIKDLEEKRRITGFESYEFLENFRAIAETTETAIHVLIELEDQIQAKKAGGAMIDSVPSISDSTDVLMDRAREKRWEILMEKRNLLLMQHELMGRFLQWQVGELSSWIEDQPEGPAMYFRCLYRLQLWKKIPAFRIPEPDSQIRANLPIEQIDTDVENLSWLVDDVLPSVSESIHQIHRILRNRIEPFLL